MRRMIISLALAAALIAVGIPAVHGQGPSVSVAPSGGSQFQSFTFTGSGFVPGAILTATFLSPDGEEFAYYTGFEPAATTAGADGAFTVTVVPAVDFAGGRAGRWRASFCTAMAAECWSREFTVSQ